jgi:Uma2 family endonuclease
MSTVIGSAVHRDMVVSAPSLNPLPPLENGDHLTRSEFLRRWEAMPHVRRAELIEGIVFMGAAVRHRQHGRPHRILIGWIDRYIAGTPGVDGGDNASVGLDDQNEPQPDAYLFLPAALGSTLRETADGYLDGPPDWIGEVAASSASIDLHSKLEVYRRAGVREYLVWRVGDEAVDWFVREGDQFVALAAESGIFKSRLFPGLWLDAKALAKQSLRPLHTTLAQGMASPEYIDFAKRVAEHAPKQAE